APAGRRRRIATALDSWREPRTLLIGVVIMAAALSEGSANDWLSLAVVDGFDRSEAVGGAMLGVFVGAMTVVRLLGTRLIDTFGRVAVLRVSGVVSLGGLLLRWQDPVTRVLGLVVIVMGLGFLGLIPFLQNERRLHLAPRAGLWGAPLLGVTFGLGWTPCIGPTLAAILTLSLDGGSAGRGALLAVAFCVGLGLPFLLVALGLESSTRMVGFLRRHRRAIMRVGGAMLVILGFALVTGVWGTWASWLQGVLTGYDPFVPVV
ncbi:cytochrome c biogenesis protein CcdA, partial [Cellulomonas septica]